MEVRNVQVGPFRVADLSYDAAVSRTVDLAIDAGSLRATPARAFALHVGGLVARRDPEFTAAMDSAEMVYADGSSVVLLARAAGGTQIERTPTTDAGWDMLRGLTNRLGRPPVVSVLGGPEGLAARALDALVEGGVARRGLAEHGYHIDEVSLVARLAATPCDVLVVGLGAPREMVWVDRHIEKLPGSLVLTCGGWLGFLAGEERRAPSLMMRLRLEWAYRVMQAPRRLLPRYAAGALVTARLMLGVLGKRARSVGPRLSA